ncbi:MAG: 30S ribosomal protein S8 [bacterium]
MYPVSNMLSGIKNANRAGRDSVIVPHSKLCLAIAKKLSKEGYVGVVSEKTRKGRPVFEVALLQVEGQPKINEIVCISKPSRRMYSSMHEIKPFKNGRGAYVYSTPKGILTDKEARKENVGGEILFNIW